MSQLPLQGKRVLVGVGGSIAAYRACDLVRRLRELGATVRVAPSKSACAFVTPLTFEALSGAPCLSGLLDMDNGRIAHIEEAYAADAVILAPATANLMAKLAHGLADEALLATMLSFIGPIVIAPAMETRMWMHPATQANVALLQARGASFVGPVAGALASGRSGVGRLAHVDDVIDALLSALSPKDLTGTRIVITAGPTIEDIDPVRYLTNRSSGKMGVALARAAARRGARVDLVHGPLKIAVPAAPLLLAHPVRSAREMCEMTLALAGPADAMLLCAAVADARPANVARRKLKKTKGELASIALEPTEDILATLGAQRGGPGERPLLVGFAAETSSVEKHARDKLARKRVDLMCANDVSEPGSGFDVDTNRVILLGRSGRRLVLGPASKVAIADGILDEVVALLSRATAPGTPRKAKPVRRAGPR